jgi:hypothetical protein
LKIDTKPPDPNLQFSLITLGCPPVTSPSLTHLAQTFISRLPKPGHLLAIVNEDDLVARVDRNYSISLSNLYASDESSTGKEWQFQPSKNPNLYTIGEIIILTERRNRESGAKELRATRVTPEQLGKLVFCDFGMHKKEVYRERIVRLRNKMLDASTTG